MKKDWLCRTSCDEKNHEIAPWWSRLSDDWDPVMIASDDLDRVMIEIQWWWSSSDDPDREMIQIQWWCSMMIQIERWFISNDEDDLKTKMTWRRHDLADIEKKTSADKLCRVNTFLVKRECWCNYKFGMYSLVFIIYCNPMFIPGSLYNEKVMSSHCG